ncbi:MAG: Gfo/Idh/MocA family oxidoreductase [Bryobacteraceae bacterium]|nr:Gfo/Idh/MocA family oxidoreductase [Bryobacteraceae bacterium]
MRQTSGPELNRRRFVAASLAAVSQRSVAGANDRLRIANIGCGRRGLLKEALDLKDEANIEVAAVCDTWRQKREKAASDVKEFTGKEPFQAVHYQDVLSRKDIDAVLIATPDHQHCTMLIDAVRAGKDVYVEKPLAMNMKELILAYDEVKKSGRVVQIGTQMRSYRQSNGTRRLIKSGGLGKILKVEQERNGYSPYWQSYGGAEYQDEKPGPADVDWKAFLMRAQDPGFDPSRYQNWYGYREYSLGPHSGLMVHFIDLVHYTVDVKTPSRVVALGGTYRWKGAFTAPDSVEVVLEYPEEFLVRYCTVFGNGAGSYAKWYGSRGSIDGKNLSPSEHWIATGKGSEEPDAIRADFQVEEPEMPHHMKNFFDCVRSHQTPIAPIEAGFNHSVAVIMADEALTSGRRMIYDAAKREVRPG